MDETSQHPAEPEEPKLLRLPRRPHTQPVISLEKGVHGRKPGAPFLRRIRLPYQTLRRLQEGTYQATEAALAPRTLGGKLLAALRKRLLGRPLATEELPHQRLSKLKALAVYSSDNLSSSAYATEEILIILVAAGTGALVYSIPITAALVALTVLVVTSYRQTIRAYPNGGGAYIVASANLGYRAGLLGGSALLVDYIMTVAVSIAAGVAAVTSAVPALLDYKVPLSLAFVAILTTANLRGIRESGTLFAIPTYFFILSFGAMIGFGMLRLALGADLHAAPPNSPLEAGAAALTPILLLRAFSSGAAALTGIEAVANGVPNFKPPEWRNAITVQAWMVSILSVFFIATTLLAHQMDIVPSETQTVASQIAKTVFGGGILFYMIQAGTGLILVLAANTAFADLPVLASVMAKDRVMPVQFLFRGDRLVFSNGIIVLGVASSAILVLFAAETTRIIPLYAFGVFTAFTLSQFGMVVHWRRLREPGWRRAVLISGIGGTVTLVVALIVAATKFEHGAWLSISIMVLLFLLLNQIKKHYAEVETQLAVPDDYPAGSTTERVMVLVEDCDAPALRAAAYARSLSSDAWALHIAIDRENALEVRRRWERMHAGLPLTVIETPQRSLSEPLAAYLDSLPRSHRKSRLTVVMPEMAPRHAWQRLLHGQSGATLRRVLLHYPEVVLVRLPYTAGR